MAIASTPDRSFVDDLTKAAGLTFGLFRADEALRKELSAAETPTVYVVDWEFRVLFSSAGDSATDEMEAWLSDPQNSPDG